MRLFILVFYCYSYGQKYGINKVLINNYSYLSVTAISCKCSSQFTYMIFFSQDYLAYIIDTGDLPIKPEQVCALFGNIEDIYEFNR